MVLNMMAATYNNEFLNTGKYLVGYGLLFILFEVVKLVVEDYRKKSEVSPYKKEIDYWRGQYSILRHKHEILKEDYEALKSKK